MALEDSKTYVDEAFTRSSDRGVSFENTFGGATSFLRRRYTKDLRGVDVAITGVPFDQAVTNRPGTRFGPRAIREASSLQPYDPPYGWGFDPLSEFSIVDYGDLAFDYAQVADFPAALEAHIAGIIAGGAGAITLGGDHSENANLGDRTGPGFPAESVVDAIETIVRTYLAVRSSADETFLETYRRTGMEPFKAALYPPKEEAKADAA